MTTEPLRLSATLFWIVDNGSDHRGKASIKRLQCRFPTLILIHLPVHASWLNQVEIYHSRRSGRRSTSRAKRTVT